jgi:SagB-type dehydrogenase family enzyme
MKPVVVRFEGNDLERVLAYHQSSKHHFGRYAPSPGFMDWATQPDPFRRFEGAPNTPLSLAANRRKVGYADLFEPGAITPAPLDLDGVSVLLELSFGLSAWKQYGGNRWALRCNPSSGNLHPTEAYVIVSGAHGIENGIHHYASYDHSLELRCRFDPGVRSLLLGLSSVFWREAWKYGERAFRYCQHDIGHALGALRYAAALLGWRIRLLDSLGDDDIAALLGLDRPDDFIEAEAETPDLLCLIEFGENAANPDINEWLRGVGKAKWMGRANKLSPHHKFDWPLIEEVHKATRKPVAPASGNGYAPKLPAVLPLSCKLPAAELIRQRRSAQAFDGDSFMPATTLYRILDATLPRQGIPPLDAWAPPPRVHLVLFVHRVNGLTPGLYVFCRHEKSESLLRKAMKAEFAWERAEGCPEHHRLFRLLLADTRQAAETISCHQDIAGESAFSLAMLAEFNHGLAEGPWFYRRLFWECGLIGQALYLEAEAAGFRGTGIGCFFDDPMHELLGLKGTEFQSLYHFTIGGPLADNRLQTLPGYWHLDPERLPASPAGQGIG